ncbi:hypothetical protein Tco_0895943 [Tanacetum coccineum]|uniref:Uncharacterized protein n=1 Tax=Tanacetum coccineum TaxID=301880 RepID=A0ABQ5CG03_9ASTR
MAVNNLYQPWRAILSMINQCLTCKTSGFDRPRYLVLQMIWGIITSINVDYAELMWEEFVQAMQTFLADKANLSIALKRGRRLNLMSASLFHLAEEDHRLGNLKFIPKGEEDEKTAAEEGGKKKSATKADKSDKPATAKQLKPKPIKDKSSKPAPTQKSKVTQEKPSMPSTVKHPKRGKVQKIHKGKSPLQLIDEDESTQYEPEPEPEYQGEGEEYDVKRAI